MYYVLACTLCDECHSDSGLDRTSCGRAFKCETFGVIETARRIVISTVERRYNALPATILIQYYSNQTKDYTRDGVRDRRSVFFLYQNPLKSLSGNKIDNLLIRFVSCGMIINSMSSSGYDVGLESRDRRI